MGIFLTQLRVRLKSLDAVGGYHHRVTVHDIDTSRLALVQQGEESDLKEHNPSCLSYVPKLSY